MTSRQQCMLDFQNCRSWEQRARLLLQYGQQLPGMNEMQRTAASLVQGCESPVWCLLHQHNDKLDIRLDTDARLLKGLLAVLLSRIQGLTPAQLAETDLADWFGQLGLERQLSASRSNGLQAVISHILVACAQSK